MKEITFLKQNADKWEAYEDKINKKESLKPSELTEMFVEITDDLSYSNTNYPQSKTLAYVNGVASRIHQAVYKNKKESVNRLVRFYAYELPSMFSKHHQLLLYSFIVFLIATIIGIVSQLVDDNFVRIILGDAYVDETLDRIKRGNPIGIYGEGNQFLMFYYITKNNIQVSFLAFISGLFTVFGTGYLLVSNGIMLGCFFTLFYQHNVIQKALKVVWIHGTLEISAIVIAGCAGFLLGNSFIFPKTHSRIQSFMSAAKDGLRIVIGLVPVFVTAGFLESFVTRYTEMHWALTTAIIGGSLIFLIWYFIILPIIIRKKELV